MPTFGTVSCHFTKMPVLVQYTTFLPVRDFTFGVFFFVLFFSFLVVFFFFPVIFIG